jgi:hypothetical protein
VGVGHVLVLFVVRSKIWLGFPTYRLGKGDDWPIKVNIENEMWSSYILLICNEISEFSLSFTMSS